MPFETQFVSAMQKEIDLKSLYTSWNTELVFINLANNKIFIVAQRIISNI